MHPQTALPRESRVQKVSARECARARMRGRGGKQQQLTCQLRQKTPISLPRPESATCRSLEVSRRGRAGRALLQGKPIAHTWSCGRSPDKRLNGGDVTVMQARAHRRPEKGIEHRERPALERAIELPAQPGCRERQALRPEPPPGPRHPRPGQGCAWPCAPSRVPPVSARAPTWGRS